MQATYSNKALIETHKSICWVDSDLCVRYHFDTIDHPLLVWNHLPMPQRLNRQESRYCMVKATKAFSVSVLNKVRELYQSSHFEELTPLYSRRNAKTTHERPFLPWVQRWECLKWPRRDAWSIPRSCWKHADGSPFDTVQSLLCPVEKKKMSGPTENSVAEERPQNTPVCR